MCFTVALVYLLALRFTIGRKVAANWHEQMMPHYAVIIARASEQHGHAKAAMQPAPADIPPPQSDH